MRRISLVVFAVLMMLGANAQKDTGLRKASIGICNCLEKQKISELKTPEEFQGVFVKCMMDSAMDYFTKTMAESEDNYKAGKDLGEQIALDLVAMNCQAFMTIAMKMASKDETEAKPKKEPEAALKNITGEVSKVEEKDFLYITVKTGSGREHVLVYLQYVPDSDTWVKDPIKLKGKTVMVKWTEYEVYQTKIKQFSNIKELKELSILVKDKPVK
jgi:hypothetical protein